MGASLQRGVTTTYRAPGVVHSPRGARTFSSRCDLECVILRWLLVTQNSVGANRSDDRSAADAAELDRLAAEAEANMTPWFRAMLEAADKDDLPF